MKVAQQLHERGQSVRPADIPRTLRVPQDAMSLNFGEEQLDAMQRLPVCRKKAAAGGIHEWLVVKIDELASSQLTEWPLATVAH